MVDDQAMSIHDFVWTCFIFGGESLLCFALLYWRLQPRINRARIAWRAGLARIFTAQQYYADVVQEIEAEAEEGARHVPVKNRGVHHGYVQMPSDQELAAMQQEYQHGKVARRRR